MTSKTHWKKLDNPNYLGAYSLMDGSNEELVVTIEKVIVEEVKTERGSDFCKVAYMKGQKPLILNATNCKTITKMVGSPYVEDWVGQQITLYVANLKIKKEWMDVIRVRSKKPVTTLPELTPDHAKWDAAKLAVSEGNTTIKSIKTNFTLTEQNEALLCDSE